MDRRMNLVIGALCAMGCSPSEEHIPHLAVPDVAEPECIEGDDYAPLRTGGLESECVQVGADRTISTGEFPAIPSPAPAGTVVYVRPGASGDGTMGDPFGDLASALASAPGAVLLARGSHAIDATLAIDADVVIVGTGVEQGTTLMVGGDIGALAFGGTSHASLSGVAIEYADCGTSVAVDAAAGTTLTLSDVMIRGAAEGLRATGATVTANGLTVRAACVRGIGLLASSSGVLDDVLVRDGGAGVEVDSSHIELSRAFVTDNTGYGVRIHGVASGGPDVLSVVAFPCNTLVGLEIDGAIQVDVTGAELSGTLASSSTGGDGLVVTGGATVAFDSQITDVADRGMGSQMIANARAGVIVDGTGTTFSMHGAYVASNAMTGVFVQNGATVTSLGQTDIRANTGAGVVVSGGTIIEFPCNTIQGTRDGMVVTDVTTVETGDALSLTGTTGTISIVDTDFARNDGYAARFDDADATFATSTGTCNGYPVGSYDGSSVTFDDTTSIDGNATAPDSPPPNIEGALPLN